MIQNLSQLCREAGRRAVILLAGRIILDTSLGGVGNDDLKIVACCNLHHFLVVSLLIRIQAVCNAGNHALVIYLLAILASTQIQGVETFLLVDHLCQSRSNRLYQTTLSVPSSLLICKIEPVIYECTKEISLTKLHNLYRSVLQNVAIITGFL